MARVAVQWLFDAKLVSPWNNVPLVDVNMLAGNLGPTCNALHLRRMRHMRTGSGMKDIHALDIVGPIPHGVHARCIAAAIVLPGSRRCCHWAHECTCRVAQSFPGLSARKRLRLRRRTLLLFLCYEMFYDSV
jgi:hypothetical protein